MQSIMQFQLIPTAGLYIHKSTMQLEEYQIHFYYTEARKCV